MASKSLVDIAFKLAKQLGANTNKFLGSRTNISFLGSGPKDDLLFQQGINTEALGAFPLDKLLPQVESSLGYATAGKLNDLQMNKLIDNLTKIKEFHFPSQIPNITDLGTGTRDLTQEGLGALRKGGFDDIDPNSEIAASLRLEEKGKKLADSMSDAEIEIRSNFPKASDETISVMLAKAEGVAPEETILPMGRGMLDDIPPPGSRGGPDDIAAPVKQYSNEIEALETMTENRAGHEFITAYVDDIYKNSGVTASVDVPKKRANAREFLYNILKKETDLIDPNKGGGTLESVISEKDYKYIMEGGGGALGDPLVLVKKYFGDEIAKRIPVNADREVIDTFVENVRFTKDKSGFRNDDPRFNPDEIPEFKNGGLAQILEI
jgi:hypothetical protein